MKQGNHCRLHSCRRPPPVSRPDELYSVYVCVCRERRRAFPPSSFLLKLKLCYHSPILPTRPSSASR